MKKARVLPAYRTLVTHTRSYTRKLLLGRFLFIRFVLRQDLIVLRPGRPGTCYLSQAGQPMNECRECAVHIRKYLGFSNGSRQTLRLRLAYFPARHKHHQWGILSLFPSQHMCAWVPIPSAKPRDTIYLAGCCSQGLRKRAKVTTHDGEPR